MDLLSSSPLHAHLFPFSVFSSSFFSFWLTHPHTHARSVVVVVVRPHATCGFLLLLDSGRERERRLPCVFLIPALSVSFFHPTLFWASSAPELVECATYCLQHKQYFALFSLGLTWRQLAAPANGFQCLPPGFTASAEIVSVLGSRFRPPRRNTELTVSVSGGLTQPVTPVHTATCHLDTRKGLLFI